MEKITLRNFCLFAGIGLILFTTGIMVGEVGEMSSEPSIATWALPITNLIYTGGFFLLGYFSGENNQ